MIATISKVEAELEVPLDAVEDTVADAGSLPEGIAGIEINRDDGEIVLQSTPTDESIIDSTNNPAILIGSSIEREVVEKDGEVTDVTTDEFRQWNPSVDFEEEPGIAVVTREYVVFEGENHEIVQHRPLREEMVRVLCLLTTVGTDGSVELILTDEELSSPVTVEFTTWNPIDDIDAHVAEQLEDAKVGLPSDDGNLIL